MWNINHFMSIEDYCRIHDVKPSTVRCRCLRGTVLSSKKFGKTWLLHRNEKLFNWNLKSVENNCQILKKMGFEIKEEHGIFYFFFENKKIFVREKMREIKKQMEEAEDESRNL